MSFGGNDYYFAAAVIFLVHTISSEVKCMVIQYKCPNCGADLQFDAQSAHLKCDSCGYEEDIEGAKDSGTDYRQTKSVELGNGARFESDEEVVEYQCQNCGAVVMTEKNTTATNCAFCGAPVILGDKLEGSFRPDKVIPFTIDKSEAEAAFKQWCKKLVFAPNAFKNSVRMKEITGLYAPFWLYDVNGQGEALMHCTRSTTHDTKDYTIIDTYHYDVYRKVDVMYRRIPADASEKLADNLMDKLEPFDYGKLTDFKAPYLAGYLSDKYDYDDKKMFKERIIPRTNDYLDDYVKGTTVGYETEDVIKRDYHVTPTKTEYSLFPVWMVYTDYENSEYSFAMNGETGKIAGEPPVSKGKVAAHIFLPAIIVFIVIRILCVVGGGPFL